MGVAATLCLAALGQRFEPLGRRAVRTTFQPFAAKTSAKALPIPADAPVIRAVRPRTSSIAFSNT